MASPSCSSSTSTAAAQPIVRSSSPSALPCFPYGIDFSNQNQREILIEGLTILRIIRGHDLNRTERRTRRFLRDALKNNTLALSSHSIDELSWRILRAGLSCIAQNSTYNCDEEYERMCSSLGVCDLWAFTCQRPARVRGYRTDCQAGDQIIRECDFHAGYFDGSWTDPRDSTAEDQEDENNLFDFCHQDHDDGERLEYDEDGSDDSENTDIPEDVVPTPGDKRPLQSSLLTKRRRQ